MVTPHVCEILPEGRTIAAVPCVIGTRITSTSSTCAATHTVLASTFCTGLGQPGTDTLFQQVRSQNMKSDSCPQFLSPHMAKEIWVSLLYHLLLKPTPVVVPSTLPLDSAGIKAFRKCSNIRQWPVWCGALARRSTCATLLVPFAILPYRRVGFSGLRLSLRLGDASRIFFVMMNRTPRLPAAFA